MVAQCAPCSKRVCGLSRVRGLCMGCRQLRCSQLPPSCAVWEGVTPQSRLPAADSCCFTLQNFEVDKEP